MVLKSFSRREDIYKARQRETSVALFPVCPTLKHRRFFNLAQRLPAKGF
jgi:hypothetical protein